MAFQYASTSETGKSAWAWYVKVVNKAFHLIATDYVLDNVLKMMSWILYWIMYWGLWVGLLRGYVFLFLSFHVICFYFPRAF